MKKIFVSFLFWISLYLTVWSQPNTTEVIACNLLNMEELMLLHNPSIKQRLLDIQRSQADFQSNQSVFDDQLFANSSYRRNRNNLQGNDPRLMLFDNIRGNTVNASVGLQKNFRNSLLLNSGLKWSRSANSSTFDDFGREEDPFFANNNAQFSLNLTQPLMKGKGRKITTANLRASELQIEANRNQFVQSAAAELANIQISYWQYLSAYRIHEVYQENEKRVQRVLDITKTLVNADKKPASDMIQVQADLADKEGQTILANQALLQAKQNLGRVIGLTIEQTQLLGIPSEDFPKIATILTTTNDLDNYLETAMENRTDLKALGLSKEALIIFLELTENDLLPQLDLTANLAYGGLVRGNSLSNLLTALGQSEGRQINAEIGITYRFPIQNNRSKAAFARQRIALQNQGIVLDNQRRNIKHNVKIALNNLELSLHALNKTKAANDFYQAVFEDERKKFQNGLTTLINLILFQERLTFTQINYIQAQQKLAIDYSTLRFEIGKILSKTSQRTLLEADE